MLKNAMDEIKQKEFENEIQGNKNINDSLT